MKKFRCHKTVEAVKIKSWTWAGIGWDILGENGATYRVSEAYATRCSPQVGGYYVRYADGYESYSPAKAFEEGYAEIDAAKPAAPTTAGGGRFDYVKYDEQAAALQGDLKRKFEEIDTVATVVLKPGRSLASAITRLEEAYAWFGKAIRDDQIARNGAAELQEGRKNG